MDTSVWIDFFRGGKSPQTKLLLKLIEEAPESICITHTIIQEILQGIRHDEDFVSLSQDLLCHEILTFDEIQDSLSAASLYRNLRLRGVTIRKSHDCLIAAVAMRHDVPVLHRDRDFTLIAENSALRLASC